VAAHTAPSSARSDAPSAGSTVTSAVADSGALEVSLWPSGTKTMLLTWVLYPVVLRNNVPVRLVELVIRAGAVSRRLRTEVMTTVTYALGMQSLCSRRPHEVFKSASISFNGGGNAVLIADRHGDELWLSEDDGTDGLCEPGPCPTTNTMIGRMPLPADVVFSEERIHIVDGPGNEHDERCETTP
jgi:hypothetical protein